MQVVNVLMAVDMIFDHLKCLLGPDISFSLKVLTILKNHFSWFQKEFIRFHAYQSK